MNQSLPITYFYDKISYELTVTDNVLTEIENLPIQHIQTNESDVFHLKSHPITTVETDLLLSSYSVEKTSTGKDYLKFSFSNANGVVSAKMWDNGHIEKVKNLIDASNTNIFTVQAKVEEYPPQSGNKSLTINQISHCTKNLAAADLLPTSTKNIKDLLTELYVYVNELQEPYQSIAKKCITKWADEFIIKAAAVKMHHAFVGGLLEHTNGLLRFVQFLKQSSSIEDGCITLTKIAVQESCREIFYNVKNNTVVHDFDYKWNNSLDHIMSLLKKFIATKQDSSINFDLITVAILLHDFGKILEYSHYGENYESKWKRMFPTAIIDADSEHKPTGLAMDDIGSGIGHIPLSMMMLQNVLLEENIFVPLSEIGEIMHCLAAHHGKLEWGSSANLATANAVIVHFVDYLDSRYGGEE